MIPEFDENGNLPPGVHAATLDEVVERFGKGSQQRVAQAESLRWLMPLCRRAGIARLLVNGSFVTTREEPNDVDCVLLQGLDYRPDSEASVELHNGLPFLEMKIVTREDYDFFAGTIFASDRDMIVKGMVEIVP